MRQRIVENMLNVLEEKLNKKIEKVEKLDCKNLKSLALLGSEVYHLAKEAEHELLLDAEEDNYVVYQDEAVNLNR